MFPLDFIFRDFQSSLLLVGVVVIKSGPETTRPETTRPEAAPARRRGPPRLRPRQIRPSREPIRHENKPQKDLQGLTKAVTLWYYVSVGGSGEVF